MRSYYTAEHVRSAEAELFTRVAPGVPMQRAAYGLARVVASELRERTGGIVGRRVTLLVGSGDNGGDALWAGSMLRRRGVEVSAVLLDPARAHAKGLAALRRSGGRSAQHVGDPDLVVDGIVGISGRGSLRPAAAALVAQVTAPIVAVDLPSGVDPDTGVVAGPAVTAAVTVTFGAYKPVHALAAAHCGRIILVPIGLRSGEPDLLALEPAEVGELWPVPGSADDKYTQGVVGVVAGSATYPGAAVLCTGAAVAATSGMVRYIGSATDQVLAHTPEVVAARDVSTAGRVQAWIVGPGGGVDDAALAVLESVLRTDLPVVVDADALTLVARHPELVHGRTAPTILTPHAGEFERLTGTNPAADRVGAVTALARDWGVTVLLKGRATLVTSPSGPVYVNEAGGSWAATAGSGDVLSGAIGALLATGLPPDLAAAAGARAHSLAANLAAVSDGAGPTLAPLLARSSLRCSLASTGAAVSDGAAPISASPLLAHIRPAIGVLRAAAPYHRVS